jgi:hypothetical protein
VSPVTIRTSDRFGDLAQLVDRQPLFDDIGQGQGERLSAHHGQVVHGAIDRQLADVAARELERADHERVGREGQPLTGDLDYGRVVERTDLAGRLRPVGTDRRGATKRRADDLAHQRRGELAAGPMAQQDARSFRYRRRADEHRRVGRGHPVPFAASLAHRLARDRSYSGNAVGAARPRPAAW